MFSEFRGNSGFNFPLPSLYSPHLLFIYLGIMLRVCCNLIEHSIYSVHSHWTWWACNHVRIENLKTTWIGSSTVCSSIFFKYFLHAVGTSRSSSEFDGVLRKITEKYKVVTLGLILCRSESRFMQLISDRWVLRAKPFLDLFLIHWHLYADYIISSDWDVK